MKFLSALILKFVMVTAILWVVLGMFGVSFGNILFTSILLTVISLAGDMLVLPRIGNVVATIADFGLAFVLIWLVGSFLYEQPVRVGIAAFLSAIVIALGEFLFHMYLQNQYFTDEKPTPENTYILYQKDNLQTEFGSEYDIKKFVEEESTDMNQTDNSQSDDTTTMRSEKRT
jgi:Protein of unknown function (DUF2512)